MSYGCSTAEVLVEEIERVYALLCAASRWFIAPMRCAEPRNAYRPRKRTRRATVAESTSSARRTRRGSDMNGMRSGAKRLFHAASGEESGEEGRLGPPDEDEDEEEDGDLRSNESTMCRHTRAESKSAVMSIANTHCQPQSERMPVSSGPTAAPTIHKDYELSIQTF